MRLLVVGERGREVARACAIAAGRGAEVRHRADLEEALVEPEIRQGLVRLAKRPWFAAFLTSIAARSAGGRARRVRRSISHSRNVI